MFHVGLCQLQVPKELVAVMKTMFFSFFSLHLLDKYETDRQEI